MRKFNYKRFLLCLFMVAFSHFHTAEAYIVAEHTDYNTSELEYSNGAVLPQAGELIQYLPTGLTGSIGSITIKADASSQALDLTLFDNGALVATVRQATSTSGAYYIFDFTSYAVTIDPTHYYYFDLHNNNPPYPVTTWYGSDVQDGSYTTGCFYPPSGTEQTCTNVKTFYFIVDTDAIPASLSITRFISTQPLDGETVTSTTTFNTGATLYINPADYVDGMYLEYNFSNQTTQYVGGSALQAWDSAGLGENDRIPITASNTVITLATSTRFVGEGVTFGYYRVVTPSFLSSLWLIGGYFSGNTVIATSTTFILGAQTTIDQAVGNGTLGKYLITGTTSPDDPILNCNPVGFSILPCVVSLFVPSASTTKLDIDRVKNNFLTKFPWGYATRLYNILGASSTAEFPSLSVDFSHIPIGVSGPWTVNMQDTFDQGNTVMDSFHDPASGLSVKDIVKPILQLFIGLFLIFIIFKDITNVKPH